MKAPTVDDNFNSFVGNSTNSLMDKDFDDSDDVEHFALKAPPSGAKRKRGRK